MKRSALAGALWAYKDHESRDVRDDAHESIARFVDLMSLHEACLGLSAEIKWFDAVCWVPSEHRTGRDHPLRNVVASDDSLGPRLVDALSVTPTEHPEHKFQPDRFSATSDVRGTRCLVVDDTWTAGATVLAAALAIQRAGAAAVSIMVIGRHYDPTYRQSHVYSDHAVDLGFESKYCTFCDRRPPAAPGLPDRARATG